MNKSGKSLEAIAKDIWLDIHTNYPPERWTERVQWNIEEGLRMGYSPAEVEQVRSLVTSHLEPLREQAKIYWQQKTKDWGPEC